MQTTSLPGYRDLFGDLPASYEQLVERLPSDLIIVLASAWNDELSEDVNSLGVQQSIFRQWSARFTHAQIINLQNRLNQYNQRSRGGFKGHLFERIVFVDWIAVELKRNAKVTLADSAPLHEWDLLMAYLHIVDRLHDRNTESYLAAELAAPDEYTEYRKVWVPLLYQYPYNERPFTPYNLYKLTSFLVFALTNYREYLREYLQKKKLSKISELMNSMYEVIKAAVHFTSQEMLPGLKYISPGPGVDTEHLDSMAINGQVPREMTPEFIKQFPLYLAEKGYVILDRGFYYRKIYLGPYFELFYDTSLHEKLKFIPYSSTVSKKCIEDLCFRHILETLQHPPDSRLVFDPGGKGLPDGYYRHGSTVLLFEFKAYVFKKELPMKPNFDDLKEYIDSRFIGGAEKDRKGISQLLGHIEQLVEGKAPFDPGAGQFSRDQPLTIYPIICFDDFTFTLPGVNEYLAERMNKLMPEKAKAKFIIKPMTMMNLDILFRFACGSGTFLQVQEMIDFYQSIIRARKTDYQRTGKQDILLLSFAPLDEIFHTQFFDRVASEWIPLSMGALLDKQHITQDVLDTIV